MIASVPAIMASLAITENADPDVGRDLETVFARLAPDLRAIVVVGWPLILNNLNYTKPLPGEKALLSYDDALAEAQARSADLRAARARLGPRPRGRLPLPRSSDPFRFS